MNDKIYHKKNIDKMTSPEQLNDYIKVTNPGVWMLLSAIALLLAGICVWGFFGKLETKLTLAAESRGGQTVLYIKENDISSVSKDMSVLIGGENYTVDAISAEPVAVTDEISEYARHTGELALGEWVYIAKLDGTLADGVYRAQIVIDSVSPLSFVFN